MIFYIGSSIENAIFKSQTLTQPRSAIDMLCVGASPRLLVLWKVTFCVSPIN